MEKAIAKSKIERAFVECETISHFKKLVLEILDEVYAQKTTTIASVSGKRLVQLLDKELETKGIPHYEDENTQGYCAGLLKAIELIQAACASGAVDKTVSGDTVKKCMGCGEELDLDYTESWCNNCI